MVLENLIGGQRSLRSTVLSMVKSPNGVGLLRPLTVTGVSHCGQGAFSDIVASLGMCQAQRGRDSGWLPPWPRHRIALRYKLTCPGLLGLFLYPAALCISVRKKCQENAIISPHDRIYKRICSVQVTNLASRFLSCLSANKGSSRIHLQLASSSWHPPAGVLQLAHPASAIFPPWCA